MKKLSLLISLLMLASCSVLNVDNNNSSNNNNNDTNQPSNNGNNNNNPGQEIIGEIKDGPILHAWDWSLQMVKEALPQIEEAGYKNIQLSPLHPSKDSNAGGKWYNLYQPLGYKVATGNENPLGNKDSLTDLTKEAAKHDINIIMDVVTNHLAGPNYYTLDDRVEGFERTIYRDHLIHTYGKVDNWYDRYQIVKLALGDYPCVQTEHEEVQKSVIRMMKEYIDCGVKGFRFDAAKHIETPDDNPDYASDFWPNVTNAIYTYGQEKLGVKPFVYGEILDNPMIDIGSYTKYMSVTDNRQANDVRGGFVSGNMANAAKTSTYIDSFKNAVLWAESHDTFENRSQETTNLDTNKLNLVYAIQISRKDATALYFARPDPSLNYEVDKAPQVIARASDDYKSEIISAANKFHNDFLGGSENLFSSGNSVVNVRKTDRNEGALIADTSCGNDYINNVNVNGLSDGEYTNIIDNQKYTVENGKVDVKLTKGLCVLEKNENASSLPKVSLSADNTLFKNSTYVDINVKNGTSMTYSINGGTPVNFSNTARIQVGNSLNNGKITINVEAINENGSTSRKIDVYKTTFADNNFVIVNVPADQRVAIWSWSGSENGTWITPDSDGIFRGADLVKDNYIVVKFNQDDDLTWGNNKGQTSDSTRNSGQTVVDYSQLSFK